MWKVHSIYTITSKINGKEYVGSAIHFNNRKSGHLSQLRKNVHQNIKLQRHYNKYSKDDLIFSIIELIMFKEDLLKREQYWIDTLKPEFNIAKIAGSNLGMIVSDNTKKKQSIFHKENPNKTQFKKGLIPWNKGKNIPCNKKSIKIKVQCIVCGTEKLIFPSKKNFKYCSEKCLALDRTGKSTYVRTEEHKRVMSERLKQIRKKGEPDESKQRSLCPMHLND